MIGLAVGVFGVFFYHFDLKIVLLVLVGFILDIVRKIH